MPGFLKELVNLGALEHCPDSVRADFDVMISAITDWQIRQIDPGKFCGPGRDNRDDAEQQYLLSARFFGEQGFDVADDRIFRLRYRHNGTDMTAQVGKRSAVNDEIVMAIYAFKAGKARSFLICTESRGWDLSRTPIITGSDGDDLILEVVPFAAFGRHHLPPEVPYLGLTILWVDNHPQEIRQEIAYLENLGASIDHLAAVDRAYEALNLRIPDLLISDWMQGGKQTGLPLLQWVRERGLELPTIIYTSRASIDRRELATAAGAMGCVDTPNDLYELVKRAVHPPFRPAVA
jgi:CheY-like chemotaxis protein